MSGIEIGALCVVGALNTLSPSRMPVRAAVRFSSHTAPKPSAEFTSTRRALFIGVLGVPGFGLLLLLQWVLA